MAQGGSGTRQAGQTAIAGTINDMRTFLESGFQRPWFDDKRVKVGQAIATGGPGVRAAAQQALNGTNEDVMTFLDSGRQRAQDDDRVRVGQIMNTGGQPGRAGGVERHHPRRPGPSS